MFLHIPMQLASVLQPLAGLTRDALGSPGVTARIKQALMASKLLTALLCATAIDALPQGGIRQALRDATLQRTTHKNAAAARKTHNNAAVASDRYFTQRLDHYDASLKNASFQQRYFVNATWFKGHGRCFCVSAARARRSTPQCKPVCPLLGRDRARARGRRA